MTEHMRKDVDALIVVLRKACEHQKINTACSALAHVLIEIYLSAKEPEPKEVLLQEIGHAYDFVKQQIKGKKH